MQIENEWRGFVCCGRLCALSQYMDLVHYQVASANAEVIGSAILQFYNQHIRPVLPFEHCIVDFHAALDASAKVGVQVVEINPFGPTVGESLFDWNTERWLLQGGQNVWSDLAPEAPAGPLHAQLMNEDANTVVYYDDGDTFGGRWRCSECHWEGDRNGARPSCPRCCPSPNSWRFSFKGAEIQQVNCAGMPVRVLAAQPPMVTMEYLGVLFPVCRLLRMAQVHTRHIGAQMCMLTRAHACTQVLESPCGTEETEKPTVLAGPQRPCSVS